MLMLYDVVHSLDDVLRFAATFPGGTDTKDLSVTCLCLYDMAWESLHPSQSVGLFFWC